MGVIEGGEVVSSGDGGGGTCHDDKLGRMMGMGEIGMTMGGEGGSRWKGETCNSSKPCHVPEEMEARERERWE